MITGYIDDNLEARIELAVVHPKGTENFTFLLDTGFKAISRCRTRWYKASTCRSMPFNEVSRPTVGQASSIQCESR